MSDTLDKAARNASEALKLCVLPRKAPEFVDLYDVRTFDSIDSDGEAPVLEAICMTEPAALAYLEGLEAGARLQSVRYESVVGNARTLIKTVEAGNSDETVPLSIGLCIIAIRNALAELEGV